MAPVANEWPRTGVNETKTEPSAGQGVARYRSAEHPLSWAVNALGAVPSHTLDRLDWHRWASPVAAYRQLCVYNHRTEPVRGHEKLGR